MEVQEKKEDDGKQVVHHETHGAHHVKKRPNWFKISVAAAILVVIIGAYIILTGSQASANAIKGDSVKLQFTVKLENGTVLFSNSSSFILGNIYSAFGLGTDALDKAVENMALSGVKTITLNPKDAFGAYNESNILKVNRTQIYEREEQTVNRTFESSVSEFSQALSADPVAGKSYSSGEVNYTVLSVSGDNVSVRIDVNVGQKLSTGSTLFFTEIISVTDKKITTKLYAEPQEIDDENGKLKVEVQNDKILLTSTPLIGQETASGKVVAVDNDTISIDANNPLAGEVITIEIKVLEIKKPKAAAPSSDAKTITGAPILDVFVMTYCPYGTQIEKGLIPAYELLKEKANFKVRFVSYTMHGEKEDTETKRQLCIREETDKFWSYLGCFLEAGDAAGCLSKAGLDSTEINDCMQNRAEQYYAVDKQLNTQYSVQGSPTVVLNDKVAQMGRDSESIKKAVCAAFSTQPSECSQALSSASPSAGFGYTATAAASASSGGCASA